MKLIMKGAPVVSLVPNKKETQFEDLSDLAWRVSVILGRMDVNKFWTVSEILEDIQKRPKLPNTVYLVTWDSIHDDLLQASKQKLLQLRRDKSDVSKDRFRLRSHCLKTALEDCSRQISIIRQGQRTLRKRLRSFSA